MESLKARVWSPAVRPAAPSSTSPSCSVSSTMSGTAMAASVGIGSGRGRRRGGGCRAAPAAGAGDDDEEQGQAQPETCPESHGVHPLQRCDATHHDPPRDAASIRTASSAWVRSATRSAGSSMPTDSRTSARGTSSGDPWTAAVGHAEGHLDERLHATQRLRESRRCVVDSQIAHRPLLGGATARRCGLERDHAPERSASGAAASAAWGCAMRALDQARISQHARRRRARPAPAPRPARWTNDVPAAARGSAGHAARGSSRTARAPRRSRSGGTSAARTGPSGVVASTPLMVSEWPDEVLGGAVVDDVGAERQRLLGERRRERVVHDHDGRLAPCADVLHARRPRPPRCRRA